MRSASVILLGLLALADPARAAPTAETVFARRAVLVTEGVWMIEKPEVTDPPFEGNVTVIEQTDGLVVVDAGGAPVSGRAIVAEIRRLSPKPVRWLIYTHYHGDHNLGAGEVRAAWPELRILSTVRTRENMTGPPMAYVTDYAKAYGDMAAFAEKQAADTSLPEKLRAGWARTAAAGPAMVAAYTGLAATPADLTFSDRITLPDAQAPVEVMFLGPANTDGDAVVWAPRQRVLASGDLVVAPVPYAAHTYPQDWIGVLRALERLDFAYLIPGHGAVQTDRAYIDRLAAALVSVRDQVEPLARAGLPLAEVRKQVDLAPIRATFAGEDPWLGFLFNAVFGNDLVSNVWKQARGEPVIQGKG